MRRFLQFFFLSVLICIFFSCKKGPLPTVVKGTVIDSKTSVPIAGARVEFRLYIPKSQSSGYDQITEAAITKEDGTFEYVLNPSAEDISPTTVYHSNYVTKNINFSIYAVKLEDTTELTIPMIKYNAALNFHIENETGQQNFVYVLIENPTFLSEAKASWGKVSYSPLLLDPGEVKTFTLPIVADEYTKIYWDLSNFISNPIAPLHQDSVYLHIDEEVNYSIIF